MKKYLSFFRLRFNTGLQYRAAALAGIVTQFFWGVMEILTFRAFYDSDPSSFPMTLQATSSYIWMQQAFLALFMAWLMEGEIFESIKNGNISYELCRPFGIYNMWFSRSLATRLSRAVLRCFPILLVAVFIPAPYGLGAPAGPACFLVFLLTLALGLLNVVAFCMIIYMLSFFTISPDGIRLVSLSMVEFFQGAIIPLPFFPDAVRKVMELLPFAAMQNVALRVYSGDFAGPALQRAVFLQIFWFFAMLACGKALEYRAMKKIVVQGG